MSQKRVVLLLKVVLWLCALAPAAWLLAGMFLYPEWVGANPVETLEHVTGMTALVLLLVTLTVTPFRRISGWNPVIKLRRPLGLFAFFYVFVHFCMWSVFDMVFDPSYMVEDITKRPYITVGFTAFVILIPLAVTSTRGWIRRLGKKWTTLHNGIYLAAILGVVHYYWLVKADTRLPVLLGACLLVLFGLRSQRFTGPRKRPVRSDADAAAPAAVSGP